MGGGVTDLERVFSMLLGWLITEFVNRITSRLVFNFVLSTNRDLCHNLIVTGRFWWGHVSRL
jgi:hypothetical protein